MKKYIPELGYFFLSIFFPFLHVSCPDMIIDIFSESYEVGILNK